MLSLDEMMLSKNYIIPPVVILTAAPKHTYFLLHKLPMSFYLLKHTIPNLPIYLSVIHSIYTMQLVSKILVPSSNRWQIAIHLQIQLFIFVEIYHCVDQHLSFIHRWSLTITVCLLSHLCFVQLAAIIFTIIVNRYYLL